jgi:hypothetical protein
MESGLSFVPTRVARRFRSALSSALSSGPALGHAAAAGRTDKVRALLEQGADIDARNHLGQTPLHLAAGCGQYETAAYLLSSGADHTLEDRQARRPLAPENVDPETLHRIRQRYRRTPSPRFKRMQESDSAFPSEWLENLRRDGLMRIPGLVGPAQLSSMRDEFQGFVDSIDEKRARGEGEMKSYDEEEHWWAEDRAYVTNNAFKHSPGLTRFFCDPRLTALAEQYYGKHAFLTRGVAMRYLPHDARENDMFGWHHDLEERRLKALILLTDLDETDQVMSYVKGSHQLFHPYKMFFRNSADLRYCKKALGSVEILQTTGRAGDVFFFDSNGVHRGNRRREARVRDTFFVEYGIDTSNLWGGDPDQSLVAELTGQDHNPFKELMAAPRKWEKVTQRRRPTWLENLYEIDAWRSLEDRTARG